MKRTISSHPVIRLSMATMLSLASLIVGAAEPFPARYDALSAPAHERMLIDGLSGEAGIVRAMGDINGDGYKDFLGWESVAAGDNSAPRNALLVYGSSDRSSKQINLESANDTDTVLIPDVGIVNTAGDLNGDGSDDWTFYRPGYGNGIVFGQQHSYASPLLVEGGTSAAAILDVVDSNDTTASASDYRQMVRGGDVNGDGFDDLIVETNEPGSYGIAVVLGSGQRQERRLDLAEITSQWRSTVRFSLPTVRESLCGYCVPRFSISAGGDVNADGFDDIVVSLSQTTFPGLQIFVLFGNATGLQTNFSALTLNGNNGFSIIDGAGNGASIAPDLNGDGIDDLLLSLEQVTVLYGKSSEYLPTLDPDQIQPADGYTVSDAPRFPVPVSAGDINDDGLGDWLTQSSLGFGDSVPRVYVVYGSSKETPYPVRLSLLDGTDGFVVDYGLQSVAAVGDVDNDGRDDLLLGADSSIVVYGQSSDDSLPAPRKVRLVLGDEFIGIRWLAPDSEAVVAYDVYRDGEKIARVDDATQFYKDVDFEYNTDYFYEVKGIDAGGGSSLAIGISAVHDEPVLPPKPDAEIYSDTAAELFFNSLSSALIHVYKNDKRVSSSRALSYFDETYSPLGQSFYLEVETYSFSLGRVILHRSPTLSLPDTDSLNNPMFPANVRFEAYSDSVLELFWSHPSRGIEPFEYEVSRDGDVIARVAGTSYVDNSFNNAWRERYEIVTVGADGLRSKPARLTAGIGIALREQRLALATDFTASVYSDSVIELFWQPSVYGIRPVGYEVLRDGASLATTKGTSFLDTGLRPNTRYSYHIRPLSDGDLATPITYPGVGVVTGGYPQPVADFEVRIYGPTLAELIWKRAPTTVREVRVLRNGAEIARTTHSSLIDDAISPGDTYEYTLVAVSFDGLETPNESIVVTMPLQ